MEPDRMENETGQEPRAVALRYDEGADAAPRVVAQGVGEAAEAILAAARDHDVPIQEDSELVGLLAACDLGAEIPLELYEAVAELLSWLYALNEGARS